MPTITLHKSGRAISVAMGENLMQALLAAQIPVASSCHGDGVCAKCRVKIISSPSHLTANTRLETELRLKHQIPANERLACQADVLGDVTVDTDYW